MAYRCLECRKYTDRKPGVKFSGFCQRCQDGIDVIPRGTKLAALLGLESPDTDLLTADQRWAASHQSEDYE